jgi:hypothetical protein
MCTDLPELLPVRQLAHIMRHLGHLIPRPGLIVRGGAGDRGCHNRALTILTRNKRPSRTVSSQTDTEVLSGEEPGKVSLAPPVQGAGRIACCLESTRRKLTRRRSEPAPFC